MTVDHLRAIMPPVLAENPPTRGPTLRERRLELERTMRRVPGLSDRIIAAWCGVSRELVAKTRRRMEAAGEILDQFERIGGDSKVYRMEARP